MTIEERNTARAIQDIAKEMKKTRSIDWEQRRYEIAKECIAAFMANSNTAVWQEHVDAQAKDAVTYADALIEELQKRK